MCGISGIIRFMPGDTVDETRLRDMRDVLRHRGPDDAGLSIMGNAGLAHRRLSIIDIAGGAQPMSNPAGDVCITYNGEIYNFRALRAKLEALGRRFSTQCDTEVILQAYEVYGEDCVQYLQGMFAFAIWDARWGKLFLARDRLGIKPLYYAHDGDELLFASEIKAILAAGGIRPELNLAILPEYLATRFVSGSETFFAGIRKLLPGHTLSWSREAGFRVQRYWRLPARLDSSGGSLQEQAVAVRTGLEQAVESHLMSDVPLGLFLSGGIDSSGIAALMARAMREPLQSFSVSFAEPGYNELHYAKLAARAAGAVHRDVRVSAQEYFSALPQLVWHEDEPIAFPSSVSLYFVSRLAQQHVKVVLTGEGADELFLGYNRYRVTAWNERLGRPYRAAVPRPVRNAVGRVVGRLPRQLRRYAERSFLMPLPGMRGLFYENFAVFPQIMQGRLLAASTLSRDPYAEGLRHYEEAPGGTLERMSYADMQTYLVELLMKQDQMSMAASIESRVPFLDHKFVEQALAIPGHYKLRGWRTKAVLREALKDVIPKEISTRKKMGFPVPIGRWLRGDYAPLLQDLVLGKRSLGRGLFNPGFVEAMVAEHLGGVRDHGDRLWLLMNLELWQRIFLDGEAPQASMDQGMPWWAWGGTAISARPPMTVAAG